MHTKDVMCNCNGGIYVKDSIPNYQTRKQSFTTKFRFISVQTRVTRLLNHVRYCEHYYPMSQFRARVTSRCLATDGNALCYGLLLSEAGI